MFKIITNLDLENAKKSLETLGDFLVSAITQYKGTELYRDTLKAKAYFNGETDIQFRKKEYINENGVKVVDIYKANNTISTDIFKKIILQENSTLFAKGVNINPEIKANFSKMFDIKLQRLGIESSLGGTAYGYVTPTKNGLTLEYFSADEFVPIVDVFTGDLVAGIRFIQLDSNLPMKIELYEIDGLTTFVTDGSQNIKILDEKRNYYTITESDALSKTVYERNYSILPVIPLYNGLSKKSRLNRALKTKIDLLEIILSDFGNNLEDMQDVYWTIKNYDGQGLSEFIREMKQHKAIKVGDDGDVKSHTTDVPYQAREAAIKILKKQIFSDSMALDTEDMSGTLTTVEINARRENLNLKIDDFENEAHNFMNSVMQIYQEIYGEVEKYNLTFIRSGLINETEIIDNIIKIRSDIDHRTALELNPMIDNDNIDVILERMKEEDMIVLGGEHGQSTQTNRQNIE